MINHSWASNAARCAEDRAWALVDHAQDMAQPHLHLPEMPEFIHSILDDARDQSKISVALQRMADAWSVRQYGDCSI